MQEGELEVNLSILPKYRFETFEDEGKLGVEAGRMVPIWYTAKEQILQRGDSVSSLCFD